MSDSEESALFSLSESSSQSSSESSSDDDSNGSIDSAYLPGETPEQYHERCCREGDGWSHAFDSRRINGATHLSISGARRDVMPLFTLDNWEIMSRGISQYVGLTHLELVDMKLSEEAIGALFGGGCACNFPQLEWLDLSRNELTLGSIMALLPFLKSRPEIKSLYLEETGINDEGARLLSNALDQIRIGELHLKLNSLGHAGIVFLLSAYNSRYLTHLDLGTGDETETAGLDAISHFLEKDGTELAVLRVSIADIKSAKKLIESVSNKSKLYRLDLGYTPCSNEQMKEVILAIQNLVCNTSSFESLRDSNHQVRDIYGLNDRMLQRHGETALMKAIEINTRQSQSISQKLRSKLRTFYFQGEFDLQPFAKISIKLFPRVLELVTKTEVVVHKTRVEDRYGDEELNVVDGIENYYEVSSKNVGDIYRLIRNCHIPDLFSFPSPASKMREQEAKIAALEMTNADLESKIALLEEMNAQLLKENEELQAGSGSAQPNKRAKTGSARI